MSGYLRSFLIFPAFLVRCQASHQEHRYARRSFGAFADAIWWAAVAKASPSVAYMRFPLTGHLDSLSNTIFPDCFSGAIYPFNFTTFLSTRVARFLVLQANRGMRSKGI